AYMVVVAGKDDGGWSEIRIVYIKGLFPLMIGGGEGLGGGRGFSGGVFQWRRGLVVVVM
nr:hypothetical protein [Tanacetum cinerariifolium]